MDAPKTFDESLRTRLETYKRNHKLSLKDLSGELGANIATISTYLSGKPEGNVAKFEAVVHDVLKAAKERDVQEFRLFSCKCSRLVEGILDDIRKTNDMGIIYGPAGIGKTCGGLLYREKYPSSLYFMVTQQCRAPKDLLSLMFDILGTSGYNGYEKHTTFIERRLKGSNRLLIFDNAQRLRNEGIAFLFDLHDITGCPIAFLANASLYEQIRENDQFSSRIGIKKLVSMDDPEFVADQILTQMLNGEAKEIFDLAVQVIEERGHARALRKQVKLAKEIRSKTGKDLRTCFEAAHKNLIREYTLKLTKADRDRHEDE